MYLHLFRLFYCHKKADTERANFPSLLQCGQNKIFSTSPININIIQFPGCSIILNLTGKITSKAYCDLSVKFLYLQFVHYLNMYINSRPY